MGLAGFRRPLERTGQLCQRAAQTSLLAQGRCGTPDQAALVPGSPASTLAGASDSLTLNSRLRLYATRPLHRAETTGPHTAAAVATVLEPKPHPEQGLRTYLGIPRLGKRYGRERLEQARRRAQAVGALWYRSLKSMLDSGRDREPVPNTMPPAVVINLANIRGATYYE